MLKLLEEMVDLTFTSDVIPFPIIATWTGESLIMSCCCTTARMLQPNFRICRQYSWIILTPGISKVRARLFKNSLPWAPSRRFDFLGASDCAYIINTLCLALRTSKHATSACSRPPFSFSPLALTRLTVYPNADRRGENPNRHRD